MLSHTLLGVWLFIYIEIKLINVNRIHPWSQLYYISIGRPVCVGCGYARIVGRGYFLPLSIRFLVAHVYLRGRFDKVERGKDKSNRKLLIK